MRKVLFVLPLLILSFISCFNDDNPVESEDYKKGNFSSPEEYVENPSVKNAVSNSGISLYEGNNPPPLAGEYSVIGEVINASPELSIIIGRNFNSQITLYNQTVSGRIDFVERVYGLTAWATGGYITGESGSFTIWQESKQSGSEAGLPEDITIAVALLISGTKLGNGDLDARGISIITNVETTNSSYNSDKVEGIWWMWEADFNLHALLASKGNNGFTYLIHDINKEIFGSTKQ